MDQGDYETTLHRRMNGIKNLMRKQGHTTHIQEEFNPGGGVKSFSIILLDDDLANKFAPIWDKFLKEQRAAQP